MTMEFIWYLVLSLVCVIHCIIKTKDSKYCALFYFLFFSIFSLITRYSGWDVDFYTYSASLKSNQIDFYYLREPGYWLSSRVIYSIINSAELTFFIFDIISFIFIWLANKNFKLPSYFPYMFLLFFPSVMGINNVYRQYLAMAIFLYSFSLILSNKGRFRSAIFSAFSMLTHNISMLFFPVIFIKYSRKVSVYMIINCLFIIFILPFALSTKSNTETGNVNSYVYIIISFLMLLFYYSSYRGKLNGVNLQLLYYQIYMNILLIVSILSMGGTQSKRVGMFCLSISLIMLVRAIEDNYKEKRLVRIAVCFLIISPTLIISNATQFLLT